MSAVVRTSDRAPGAHLGRPDLEPVPEPRQGNVQGAFVPCDLVEFEETV